MMYFRLQQVLAEIYRVVTSLCPRLPQFWKSEENDEDADEQWEFLVKKPRLHYDSIV